MMHALKTVPTVLMALMWLALPLAHAEPTWLPPSAQVAAALQASPELQQARARQQAQWQRARATELGPAEWALRLGQQQRRVREPQERFAETSVALERPLRLWGKAAMDAQLAEQDRALAWLELADARHEASRALLSHWMQALHAQQEAASAEQELALARELQRQAQARLRLGDASALDARLAQAELERALARQALAQAQISRSTAQLRRLYPGLPDPTWPASPEPLPMSQQAELAQSLAVFLQRHHELQLLRGQALRQQHWAQRLERERRPDPTVGVHALRERAGAEQVLGLSLSLPLAGSYRESLARAALAEAQEYEQRWQHRQLQLAAEFEARWALLARQESALAALSSAARTQRAAADSAQRAYLLGEYGMAELIQNRRLANEQDAARQRLQLDWLHQQALLALDLHQLWDLDDD